MKLIEFRIFMPLSLEENQIGQLWSFAEVSRLNTSGGEGCLIKANQPFQIVYDDAGRIVFDRLPEYDESEALVLQQKPKFSGDSANGEQSASAGGSGEKSVEKSGVGGLKKLLLRKSASKDSNLNNSSSSSSNNNNSSNSNSNSSPQFLHPNDSKASLNSSPPSPSSTTASAAAALAANDSTNRNEQGQYAYKLYMIASKLPWYLRKLLPKDSTTIHEKSWNMYPVVKTIISNEFFKNNARVELNTITRECVDGLAEENVHNLSAEQLEKREVINIDIADALSPALYKEDEDPTLFRSAKTGRGPLCKGEWMRKQRPLVCCYKLVCVDFRIYGLQTRIENYVKNMYKQMFTVFHRQIFCWIDKWHELTLADVRAIEENLAKMLEMNIDQGEISNAKLADAE